MTDNAWKTIDSAPKDGTPVIGARFGRDEWLGKVWWQPEFEAFIESCHLMMMAGGWTFEDGTTQQLHSPEIPDVTHWAPLPPPPGENRMTDWQPISTAPRDGRLIQARIPEHGDDNIIAWMDGYLDEDDNDCARWTVMDEKEPPDDWTDGVCWERNADLEPSTKPTHWKPLQGEQP